MPQFWYIVEEKSLALVNVVEDRVRPMSYPPHEVYSHEEYLREIATHFNDGGRYGDQ